MPKMKINSQLLFKNEDKISSDVCNIDIVLHEIKDIEVSKDKHKTCRLCLSDEGIIEIFKAELLIVKKIHSCCELEVNPNDGLPDHICNPCANTLNTAMDFKEQCQINDRILRQTAANTLIEDDIKSEVKSECYSDNENNNFYDGYDSSSNYDLSMRISKRKKSRDKGGKIKGSIKKRKHKHLEDDKKINEIKLEVDDKESVKKKKKTLSKSTLCPFCGKVFQKMASLNAHIKTHRTDRPFTCDICSKTFFEKWHLHEHKKTHTDVKSYPCEACGKLFKTSRDTKRHMDTVHKKIRTVECPLCHKKLSSNSGLKLHMKSHTGEKEFQCDICSRKFISKPCLTLHIRVHTGEKPYSCRFCESRFAILKTLKEHERIHTGETPYSCPACGKGFSQKSNMKSHFRYNHRGMEYVT